MQRRRRSAHHVAVVLLLLVSPFFSTRAASSGLTPEDEETGGNGAQASALSWLLGAWHGVRRDGADGSEAAMTSRFESILDGAGLSEHIAVTLPGGKVYSGFAAAVHDPTIGRWVRIYVNATRRHFVRLEGEMDGENRIVWESISSDRSRENRIVTERTGPDRWRRTSSVSEDGGVTWRVLFVDELERDTRPSSGER